jgi:uncharacterized protein YjiS (DUF1127 family)
MRTATKSLGTNLAAPVDAPIATLFHIVHHWRRATEQRCSLAPT